MSWERIRVHGVEGRGMLVSVVVKGLKMPWGGDSGEVCWFIMHWRFDRVSGFGPIT